MDSDNFRIPNNYYIKISSSFDGSCSDSYSANSEGACCVELYKSLDRHVEKSGVEHVVPVGSFGIKDFQKKSVEEFLKELRVGIERQIQKRR